MVKLPGALPKRSDLFALLALIGFGSFFCQELILGEGVPFFRDLSTYFYPLRFTLFQSLGAGQLPLWNPHMAAGFPQLADFQSGVFYPPHLLLAVLSFFTAIRVLFVFHFLVAGVGAYCLLRHWRYPTYLAIVAALLFSLGGVMVSLSNLLNHFQSAVWLPWVVLSWEAVLCSNSWKNFLTFTGLAATQLLAGSPEIFAMSMAFVFVDGLRFKAVPLRKTGLLFVSGAALVTVLTMVQLLPTMELLYESRRHQLIPPQEALNWSLKPLNLINFFYLDKEVDLSRSNGLQLFFDREPPFFISYYLGAISLIGFCVALYIVPFRQTVSFCTAILVSVLMALGSHTPIYPFLLQHLPILGSFRFPEKFLFMTHLLVLVLVMRGLRELFHDKAERRQAKTTFWILAMVCFLWAALYFAAATHANVLTRFVAERHGAMQLVVEHAAIAGSVMANLERQMILSLGVVSLFVLFRTALIRRSLFRVLLIAIVFVDLTWAHRVLLFPLDPKFVTSGPRIMDKPGSSHSRLFYYPSQQNLHPSFFKIEGRPPNFKRTVALSFHNLLPNEGVFHGFDYFQEIDALARRPYTDFLSFANSLDPAGQMRLLRALNVGYLISFEALSVDGIALEKRFPEYFSWLYRVAETVPRAYIVNESMVEKESRKVLEGLFSPDFNPLKEVFLDEPLSLASKKNLFRADTEILKYYSSRVLIRASLNSPGVLVLADSYYPGWKAYVNGKEEKILRANLFFRAVPLPAGEHTVEFRYEPMSFKIGLIISLLTLSGLIVVSAVRWVIKRKRPDVTAQS